jgi:succinyl-CoA synthetase beta subunit
MRAGGARMRLYEYEAKAILKKFGMAASQGPWLS